MANLDEKIKKYLERNKKDEVEVVYKDAGKKRRYVRIIENADEFPE